MKCPYCVSEIGDEALVCPNCARDLYLFKPLLAKIEALEQKVLAVEESLAKKTLVNHGVMSSTPSVIIPPPTDVVVGVPDRPIITAIAAWIMPLALLFLAHLLIAIVYDLNTVYLRAVSLIIPLPFGIAVMAQRRRNFSGWIAAAFMMALIAVLGMSWATSIVDSTPALPADRREWKELIEYAFGIMGSYVVGMVLGQMLWRHRHETERFEEPGSLMLKLAELVSSGYDNTEKIHSTIKKLQDVASSLMAAGTTVVSIYMGFKGLFGG